jgi:hypothetical protein
LFVGRVLRFCSVSEMSMLGRRFSGYRFFGLSMRQRDSV